MPGVADEGVCPAGVARVACQVVTAGAGVLEAGAAGGFGVGGALLARMSHACRAVAARSHTVLSAAAL